MPRIYRCNYWDADLGQLVSWHATRRDAERELARQVRENGPGQGAEEVEPVDFPTRKADVIAWLNRHLSTDND